MSVTSSSQRQDGLILVDIPRDGEANMAIDQALLDGAREDSPIVMRIYRWKEPTLSLGHFQTFDDREFGPQLGSIPRVRRRTGGGAIVHDQELTYSIVLPNRGNKSKGHSEQLYRSIHQAAVDEFRKLGWDAALSESCTCGTQDSQKAEPFLCFLRRSPVDLVVGLYKILGSAQRRTSAGLLQHGSFLLRSSSFTPDLLGLLDCSRMSASADSRVRLPDLEKLDEQFRVEGRFDAIELGPRTSAGWDVRSDLYARYWSELLVRILKNGVSSVIHCDWQMGALDDLLANCKKDG